MPVIVPSALNTNPCGKTPPIPSKNSHVIVPAPVAASLVLYDVPTMPAGNVPAELITGGNST